ncbi:MAG TPA: YraN family protein [Nocardioidaceae bacterium]|nr:YraN family protein [Nocardioidaceae bacterium]
MATYAQRKALGDYGERLAAEYLASSGLRVLDRNWRCRAGEIDIVALDGAVLVVCEVKTRRSTRFGSPVESITPAKAGRLHRLGWQWLREHDRRCAELRVDVVAVLLAQGGPPQVEHLTGVS